MNDKPDHEVDWDSELDDILGITPSEKRVRSYGLFSPYNDSNVVVSCKVAIVLVY